MIVCFGGIKSSCGKTTLATNLAVLLTSWGKKVLLVDSDEQRCASDWAELRESLGILTPWTTVQLIGSTVGAQINKMRHNYDYIIVDTGGVDRVSQRAALTVADILIVPVQPRNLDIWKIGRLTSLLSEVRAENPKLIAYSVLNCAECEGKDNEYAEGIFKETDDIICLPIIIGQRKVFGIAASKGLGVIELENKKAIAEIIDLYNIVFLGIKSTAKKNVIEI